jgi:hypothetical protein
LMTKRGDCRFRPRRRLGARVHGLLTMDIHGHKSARKDHGGLILRTPGANAQLAAALSLLDLSLGSNALNPVLALERLRSAGCPSDSLQDVSQACSQPSDSELTIAQYVPDGAGFLETIYGCELLSYPCKFVFTHKHRIKYSLYGLYFQLDAWLLRATARIFTKPNAINLSNWRQQL